MTQARDLSSMHAPMFGLRACLNFFGQGSRTVLNTSESQSFNYMQGKTDTETNYEICLSVHSIAQPKKKKN